VFLVTAGTDTITNLGNGTDSVNVSSGAVLNATLSGTTPSPSWTASSDSINSGTTTITARSGTTTATVDLSSLVNTAATGFLKLDVSLATGTTTFTLPTTANQRITVLGGSGTDTIAIAGQTLIANVSISGGAGTDILSSTTGADFSAATITDIETLTFAGTVTLTAAQLDGFTTVTGSGTPNLTLSNAISATTLDGTVISTDATTITLANVSGNAITLQNATIPSTNTLKIDATALTSANGLTFDGSAEADGKVSVTGGAGNDVITGSAGVDTLVGGAGNDIIKTTGALFVGLNAVLDSIDGGADTDSLLFTDSSTAVTVGGTDLTRIQNVEKITTVANSAAISITINTTNQVASTGSDFTAIDLSGDTNPTGTNVISSTGADGITTIIGSAGVDNITLGAAAPATTINGGTGADTLSVTTTGALSVSDSDGIAITVTAATSNITTTSALTATTITGGTGVDTITLAGSVSNVATITGGRGADVIDLGANHTGGVKWILTAESAAPTSANTVDAVISNYVKSLDKISTSALILGVQTATAGVGVATISAGGVATFNAADTTLTQHFAAVAAALQATPGATAIWTEGSDSYVYVSDGILANTATDYTVKLVGVTAGALTISSNAITAIA
jgi:Ca2+-binding RTX toxin-like protein